MSGNRKVAVLPLLPDFVEKDVPKVKHTSTVQEDDGRTNKTTVEVMVITEAATAYQFLRTLDQFRTAAKRMQWEGEEQFNKFAEHLEGEYVSIWEGIVDELPDRTDEDFKTAIDVLKEEFFSEEDYDVQMDYLRAIRKPHDVSPKKFLQLLRAQNTLVKEIPNGPAFDAGFSDQELRRVYLQAMPKQWRENFADAGYIAATQNLQMMRGYFERQAAKDPFVEKKADGTGTQKNKNNKDNGRGGNNKNKNKKSNGKVARIKDSDPCPLPGHGNHTWGECRCNAFNKNNRNNNDRSNSGRKGRDRHESHQTEAKSSDKKDKSKKKSKSEKSYDSDESGSDAYMMHDMICKPTTQFSKLYKKDIQEFFYSIDDMEPSQYDTTSTVLKEPTIEEVIDEATTDVIPMTLTTVKRIGEKKVTTIFKSLFDSGGTHTMLRKQSLPRGTEIFPDPDIPSFQTAQGSFRPLGFVYLQNVIFPEFSCTRHIKKVKALVFDAAHVPYDIIYGRRFLSMANIQLNFATNRCRWYDSEIPFHTPDYFDDKFAIRNILQVDSKRVEEANFQDSFYTVDGPIQAAKYERADLSQVVAAQLHLTPTQREELLQLFLRYEPLFSGKLGRYPKRTFHIELKKDARAYHCKQPYPIAQSQLPLVKAEIERQCKLGILERVFESEWGMPMFIRPKKDGTLRTVADLRALNSVVVRKPYLLPKMQEIFWRRRGYSYMTKIDISMQYYCFVLDDESSWLCVIVTPFGKFRYKVLPMGLTNSPDWAQAAMEELFSDMLHEIEVYLDDIGIFSSNWDEHIKTLDIVLARLQEAGFTVNPLKCEWGVKETDWLGFWMTPTGLKPWKKKVEGIVKLAKPTTIKQLRAFIGMINFYRTMFKQRAHILAPLTELTKLKTTELRKAWSTQHDEAFQQAKAMVCQDILIRYPDPNKPFVIETDASDYQIGSVVSQDGYPVAMFSRKLQGAQRRYPIPDKEALSIVETLTEFRPLLLGAQIIVKTDHKNLVQRDIKSQRLLNWRLLIEEFSPTLEYVQGSANVGADTLSRYPLTEGEQPDPFDAEELTDKLNEAMLFYPEQIDQFPLTFDNIRVQQYLDVNLVQMLDTDHARFQTREYYGTELICRRLNNNNWKIVLPTVLVDDVIAWYHLTCGHAGADRLYKTITTFFCYKGLKDRVVRYVNTCDSCQRNKKTGVSNAHVPPKEAVEQPWETVAVDLVGPWQIKVENVGTVSFSALTIIDVATTLAEIVRIEAKSSHHISFLFENTWLARYPKPMFCIHDPGPEFVGAAFQNMLHRNGIQASPTTIKNPQANAVCERLHSTIGDTLRTFVREDPPQNVATLVEQFDALIASAQYAVRTAVHSTMQVSPGAMVFGRDMVLPIPTIMDFALLRQKRQTLIDENNRRENLRRRFKDYAIGDEVLILTYKPNKMEPRAIGPFPITQVHVNGTVSLQRAPNITERINVRRIRPYLRR